MTSSALIIARFLNGDSYACHATRRRTLLSQDNRYNKFANFYQFTNRLAAKTASGTWRLSLFTCTNRL